MHSKRQVFNISAFINRTSTVEWSGRGKFNISTIFAGTVEQMTACSVRGALDFSDQVCLERCSIVIYYIDVKRKGFQVSLHLAQNPAHLVPSDTNKSNLPNCGS
jgi:hypothetical protein